MAWSQMVDGDLIGDRAAVGVGEVDPQCRECSVAVGVIGVIGVIGDGDRRRIGGRGRVPAAAMRAHTSATV